MKHIRAGDALHEHQGISAGALQKHGVMFAFEAGHAGGEFEDRMSGE